MRLALIADCYPPLRSSGAVQIRDLTRALVAEGHQVTVLLPAIGQKMPWYQEESDGAVILRLSAPRTKDISHLRRLLAESAMPWAMARNLARSPFAGAAFDAVIWYSPSIFFGPLVRRLKKRNGCPAYLILRDIFPDWAADLGILPRKGPAFRLLRGVARAQYRAADIIGVQSPGNLALLRGQTGRARTGVLQNWLGEAASAPHPVALQQSPLAGRKIFLYAGNMGIAQGLDVVIDLARAMEARRDVGFLFLGRGSEADRLRGWAGRLSNVLFHDEIAPDEIPALCADCSAGLVILDPRHQSHNIPGKFLTYMQNGLPVLACVNPGNDLTGLIRQAGVGVVAERSDPAELHPLAEALLVQISEDRGLSARCRDLFARNYKASLAASQITEALRAAADL
ncbi:glycosyltransferase family 4 protein [Falsigemmobacter intermedius]|uniref:glycosyltransferase family 4 protein n=1 Tax=Falsigemmobacter intermedius TaxID=1553448 RepID=UPI003F032C09